MSLDQQLDRTRSAQLEDWIDRTGKGEKDAFCSLYVQTKRILFSYALSILHNREDAEDAVQDTYLRIRSASSWIRTMIPSSRTAKTHLIIFRSPLEEVR